jgi:quercetin dioxygenase-like cupin family protein
MSTDDVVRPYRIPAGEGISTAWFKTGRVVVKAGHAETGGGFSQFETDDPYGTATALHVHRDEDETFYVLEGEVTLQIGESRFELRAGDFAFAPRNVPHAYAVRSETARMLVTYCPGGLEELFVEIGATGETPQPTDGQPAPEELARLFGERGVEIVGPPLAVDEL